MCIANIHPQSWEWLFDWWEGLKYTFKSHFGRSFYIILYIQKFWLCSCVGCLTRSVNVTKHERNVVFKFLKSRRPQTWCKTIPMVVRRWEIQKIPHWLSLKRRLSRKFGRVWTDFLAILCLLFMILDNILGDYSGTFVIHRRAWSQNLREQFQMLELHTLDI